MRLITEITTQENPKATTNLNKFKTNGLKVSWDTEVKDVFLISDINKDKTLSEQNASSLGYNITIPDTFKTEWNMPDRQFFIIKPNTEVSWVTSIINMNCNLGGTCIARILNHMLAWDYCIKVGRPIIVLEAGSIINVPIYEHLPRNSIIDINNKDLYYVNNNWASLKGVDCYCVDQFMAKKLFNHILDQGIRDPLHIFIRDDLFTIRYL